MRAYETLQKLIKEEKWNIASTYNGDPKYNELLKYINNENNILDVGSGCGKLCIYLAIKMNIFVEGIELLENRYKKSETLLENFNCYDKVNFINEDFNNLFFGQYDIIYCCNLVFSEKDNYNLYYKLEKEFFGLFILYDYNNLLAKYLVKKEKVKCSWNNSTEIFIFKK